MTIVTLLIWVLSTSAVASETYPHIHNGVITPFNHQFAASYVLPAGVTNTKWFSGAVEAVTAAANQYNPLSIAEDREYMGAVLKNKYTNMYFYTAAAGEVGKNRISTEITVPRDHTIIAFWHTHGAGDGSRYYFSKVDVALVRHWQLPLYLADSSGYLKVLTPEHRSMTYFQKRSAGVGYLQRGAKGRRVKNGQDQFIKVDTGLYRRL